MQRETTSTEFVGWIEFLTELDREEWSKTNRADYYMAQIALEVARTRVEKPGALKLESFLMRWVTADELPKENEEDVKAKRLAASKAAWLGFTGANRAAKKGDKGKPARRKLPPGVRQAPAVPKPGK